METEPVPAPTSQQTARSVSASLERQTARTSLFVIGTTCAGSISRKNTSSGSPCVTTASGAGFSISATLSLSNSRDASSAAVPQVIFSSG